MLRAFGNVDVNVHVHFHLQFCPFIQRIQHGFCVTTSLHLDDDADAEVRVEDA